MDAVRALKVEWKAGTAAGEDDASVLAKVKSAELPMAVPAAGKGNTVDSAFTFYFKMSGPG